MRWKLRDWVRKPRVAVLLLSFATTLAGCAGIEATFNVLAFQKHPASGVSEGQNLLVYMLRPGGRLSLPPPIEAHDDPYFQNELAGCTRGAAAPPTRSRFGGGLPVTAAVVARAGQLLLDSAYSAVEQRAKRLEAMSQKTYSARVSWTTRPGARWDDVSCILLVRLTKPAPGSSGSETGLIVLLRREPRGVSGSIMAPSYVLMNNAGAVTGNAQPATVQLNLALAFASLVRGSVSSGEQVTLPQINVPFGEPLRLCEGGDIAGNRSRCPHASGLFADPPDDASALQVGVSATETGSSATIAQHVEAGNAALRSIARPVRDAALRRLVLELDPKGQ